MKYRQRDIVEVNFLFPDGSSKAHPAIIISNNTLQEDEFGLVYLVLISSKGNINPQYSYPLTNDMLLDIGERLILFVTTYNTRRTSMIRGPFS